MSRTRDLLVQFSSPFSVAGVTVERVHKIRPNRVRIEMWCDIVDTTPDDPADHHRHKTAGDLHAALSVPIPLWVARLFS